MGMGNVAASDGFVGWAFTVMCDHVLFANGLSFSSYLFFVLGNIRNELCSDTPQLNVRFCRNVIKYLQKLAKFAFKT